MQSMALVRFLIAGILAVGAAHTFAPETAIWVMLGCLVIWPGPLNAVRFVAGIVLMVLATGSK
jgi:uncharacterized membrane protein YraQ (UPF0718 family)